MLDEDHPQRNEIAREVRRRWDAASDQKARVFHELGLFGMVHRFQAEGTVSWVAGIVLQQYLDRARRAVVQGNRDQAIRSLRQFRLITGVLVSNTTARTVLQTDADAVIASLRM